MLKRKTPLKAKKGFKKKFGFAILGKGGTTNFPDSYIDEAGALVTTNKDVIEFLSNKPFVQRASTFKAKPKRLPVRKKREGPTQMDVFREIWAEREHFSEVSGAPLGDEMLPIFMSHLLPKGSYRKYKLDKRNIVLMTIDEHHVWHVAGPTRLQYTTEGWAAICDKYYDLLREANGVQ